MTDITIDWRQNCLTSMPHDGRPDAIWNIPLVYATTVIFSADELKALIVNRIDNDAMQFFTHGDPRYDTAWADRVKANVLEMYDHTLAAKVEEITNYYKSKSFKDDVMFAIERVEKDKLNVFYQPLHPHDTLNMLCRILGVPAARKAAEG